MVVEGEEEIGSKNLLKFFETYRDKIKSDAIVVLDTENIEVQGSHCGMGWNAMVLEVIADRLSQPRGRWNPYRSSKSPALDPIAA